MGVPPQRGERRKHWRLLGMWIWYVEKRVFLVVKTICVKFGRGDGCCGCEGGSSVRCVLEWCRRGL
jgi:hypothetical protein